DREGGAHRDLGLAEADVAADEAVHRVRRLEVLLHRLDRARLVLRLAVGELGLEPLEPFLLDVVRDPRPGLALRVQLQQLARHLPAGLAGARLPVVPRLAPELRERRRARIRADVARDLADLLVRHEHAVLAAEAEEQVVARHTGDFLRLEAEKLRDAMVLVHDVVAGAEVGEARERASGGRRRAWRAPAKDLRVGQECDAELPPDEPAPRRRDDELEPPAHPDAAEAMPLAPRPAPGRGGDDPL